MCHHSLLKGFNERITSNVTRRFAHLGNKQYDRMEENCDPESVDMAARRLITRPEERKILMVLSDGQPAFRGDMYTARKQLLKVVHDIENAGIEVIGIGIEDSSVSSYYPKHVVISDVMDLPAAIMGEMQRLLLK